MPGLSADSSELSLDVALHVPARAPHVNDEPGHETAATSASGPSSHSWFEAL